MESPRFAGAFSEKDGPGLFRPRALNADVWVSVVTSLQAFDRGGINPVLDKKKFLPTPQAAASIISARKTAAAAAAATTTATGGGVNVTSHPPLNTPFKVIEPGANGELYVLEANILCTQGVIRSNSTESTVDSTQVRSGL